MLPSCLTKIKRLSFLINQGYLAGFTGYDFTDYCYRARGYLFDLINDRSAWGSITRFTPKYYEILPNLDLSVPINFKYYPKGVSTVKGTFVEDENIVSVGFNFLYLQRWQFDVAYVNFLGNAEENPRSDRDYVSAVVRYAF